MNSPNDQPNCSKPGLFPAFSACKKEEEADTNKEWLCNSSFNTEYYNEALQQYKLQESSTKIEETIQIIEDTEHRSLKRKKESHKIKKKHSSKEKLNLPEESFFLRSQLQKLTFIEETGLSYERAYHTDVRYDAENTLFDCFERKNIAKYQLKFQLPYGLSLKEQVLWPQPLEKKPEKNLRYFSKKALKRFVKLETDIFQKGSLPPNLISDYLPLSTTSCSFENKHPELNFYGISIDWKKESFKKPKSSDVGECSEEVSELDKEIREKTVSFNKQLADSPHNIKLWLDFIEFQDEILKSNSSSNKVSESSVIDKKIAILEKAVKLNPASVDLIVAKLNFCKDSWKLEELTSSWENLLFLNPHNPVVWQQYIIFILTNLKYFSTQRIVKIYTKCIKTLSNISEGIIQSHKAPPDIVYRMIDIFSQFCYILQSCGFTERAIASFQALIEFNFFSPPSMQTFSTSDQIALFEPFWDSGALRFGEDGAIGWASTMTRKQISSEKIISESDLNNFEDEILCEKLPLSKTWCKFERLREFHHWLPWRPNPEYDQTSDDVDDLDRTILFEDVSIMLFRIHEEKEQFYLLLKFINFLNFNIHELSCTDAADNNIHSQSNLDKDFLLGKLNEKIFAKHEQNPLNFKQLPYSGDRINFINNVFSQCIDRFSPEYRTMLSRLWLKSKKHHLIISQGDSSFKQNLESLKSFAKSMLQKTENRNCLLLWLEFIEIEELSNVSPKTKKTFQKLLMSSSAAVLNGTMKYDEFWYFVRLYVEWCIGLRKNGTCRANQVLHDEIIWLLLQVGNRETYVSGSKPENKPASVLKAAKGFKCFLDQHLAKLINGNPEFCACLDPFAYSALDCLMCYAYFNYFTQGIDAALTVMNDTTKILELKPAGSRKRYILEHLCVLQSEIINFNTWNSATTPIKPLQLHLYKAVEKFPYNSQLLLLLIKLRCASSVVSPTRRFFYKLLNSYQQLCPVTWIFAIASELSIVYSLLESCEVSTMTDVSVSTWGINWKIRALYEKSLKSPLCSHTPSLWRSYIKFEMECGDTVKAKNIFHRSLQHCVWSKELHMDAIEYFPEDLRQILDLMFEKQIRIHTPLEEVALLMEHAT